MKQSFPQHPQMPANDQIHHHCGSAAPAGQAYYPPNYPQHDQYLYRYGDNAYLPPAQTDANGLPVVSDYPPGTLSGWFDFSDSCYLKGFLTGAAITFLLTNSAVQKAVVRGAVKLMSAVQGSVEEVKEQINDIKAEMSQKEVKG